MEQGLTGVGRGFALAASGSAASGCRRHVLAAGPLPLQLRRFLETGPTIEQVTRDFLGQGHPGAFASATRAGGTGQYLQQLATHHGCARPTAIDQHRSQQLQAIIVLVQNGDGPARTSRQAGDGHDEPLCLIPLAAPRLRGGQEQGQELANANCWLSERGIVRRHSAHSCWRARDAGVRANPPRHGARLPSPCGRNGTSLSPAGAGALRSAADDRSPDS